MRVTTNGRYGLRIMLDVALNATSGAVRREDIAMRQGITAHHIAQLTRRLSKAGLARGMMGPGGGYRLSRDAAQISVGEIIKATEGACTTVICITAENGQSCSRMERCAAHLLWLSLSQTIERHLDKISLQELCTIARQLEACESPPGEKTVESILAMIDQLPVNPRQEVGEPCAFTFGAVSTTDQ